MFWLGRAAALEKALRWKTALDAANKGAWRKSRQARRLRAEVVGLKVELSNRESWLEERRETVVKLTSANQAALKKLAEQEVELTNFRAASDSLRRDLKRAREVGVR